MESPDELKVIKGWKGIRWVLGRWSHHMTFKKSSSKWKGNILQVESSRKMGKYFGIVWQSFIREQKRIQNPPQQ
jgi:hypothetical protein